MNESGQLLGPTSLRARLSRRDSLIGAASLLASSAIPALTHAEEAPIKIGLVMAKQGPWADHGRPSADGARIALEQAGGKALGRPVEIVWHDEPNPQEAAQNMQKAIQEDKVAAIIGGGNSAVGLALSAVAKQARIPLIVYDAAAREITGAKCNRFTFSNLPTVPTFAKLMGPLAGELGKKWYFLVGAYAFGRDIYRSMQAELKALGGTEVGYDEVAVGTADFSALILKIQEANPEVVVLGLAGAAVTGFMTQLNEFGLKGKIALVSVVDSDNDLWAADQAAVTGLHGMPWHFSDPRNGPEDAKLNSAIMQSKQRPAGESEYLGWIAMRLLLAAIDKAGSTEPMAIVRGLETVKLPEGSYYREWDHQLMHRIVAVRAKDKIESRWDLVDVVTSKPDNPADIETFYGSKDEIGCHFED